MTEYTEPKPWQRFYMGYRERFVDDCVLELQGGQTCVYLSQAPSAKVAAKGKQQQKGGKKGGPVVTDKDSDPALTGTTVWDGAVVLSHYLTETDVLQQHMETVASAAATAAAAAGAHNASDPANSSATAAAAADGHNASDPASTAAAEAEAGVHQASAPAASAGTAAEPSVEPLINGREEFRRGSLQGSAGIAESTCGCTEESAHAEQAGERHPKQCNTGEQVQGTPQQDHPQGSPHHRVRARLPNCLELGAGTGAVSLALLACNKIESATITDIPDLLPHIHHNVERNASLFDRSKAIIQPLSWGPPGNDILHLQAHPHQTQRPQALIVQPRSQSRSHPSQQGSLLPPLHPSPISHLSPTNGETAAQGPNFDLITGSDLIYYSYTDETPHTRLLIWTLKRLMRPHTLTVLSLSLHHNPEEVFSFLDKAKLEGLDVQEVKAEIPEEMRVPDVMVVQMRLKQ